MSSFCDWRPNGSKLASREAIDKAEKVGDVHLLALYARNSLSVLEEVWKLSEEAHMLASQIEESLRKLVQ